MKLYQDKRALVTGAASGIGRAIALSLAREGAIVLGCDVDANGGAASAAQAEAAGDALQFVPADLSTDAGQDALLAHARATLGGLDIFVHCASPKRQESQTALAVTDAQWDLMLNVNLRAGFRLGRAIGADMRAQRSGNMLYITSLHAHSPRNLPHYSASKAGLTMLVKELARVLSPHGVRVNALAPGAIAGGGFAANPALAAKIAMGRLGTAQDVADAALGLLNDRFNAYVTGTTLVVDGGLALYNWLDAPAD